MEKSASASSLEQEVIEDAFVCKSKDTSFTEDNIFYGITRSNILCSTVAGQNVCVLFFWGVQLGRVKPMGVGGKNPLKMFEIFIPEIAANASNFKN